MQVTEREAKEWSEEPAQDPHRSIWFWIIPLLLSLIFVAVFAGKRHATTPRTAPVFAANLLPPLGVVQFESGQPNLTPDGQATLDRAAMAMHGNPNVRLRLEGYDSDRITKKKKDRRIDPLTLQRAQAVEIYLDTRGIERTRITGGTFPRSSIHPSAFPQRNADSRRAELYAQ